MSVLQIIPDPVWLPKLATAKLAKLGLTHTTQTLGCLLQHLQQLHHTIKRYHSLLIRAFLLGYTALGIHPSVKLQYMAVCFHLCCFCSSGNFEGELAISKFLISHFTGSFLFHYLYCSCTGATDSSQKMALPGSRLVV